MRTSLKWLVPAVALVACGGNVIVDGTGAGSTTTTGGSTFTTTFSTGTITCDPGCGGAISSGTFTTSSSSSTSSTSGVTSDCNTCNDWLSNVSNGVSSSSICPTGPSANAFVALTNCACTGGPCSTNCLGNLCTNQAPAESCNACLMEACSMAVQHCQEN